MPYRKCPRCNSVKDVDDCSLHYSMCNACFKHEHKLPVKKDEGAALLTRDKLVKPLRVPEASSMPRMPSPGATNFHQNTPYGPSWSTENKYSIGKYYHEKLHKFDVSKATGCSCKKAVEMLNQNPDWSHQYAVCFDNNTGHYYLLTRAGTLPGIQEALTASSLLSTQK
eukprot:GGOE01013649.1.p1 GENE.GGOE01013649.1~~GGOE01013649.1.p1  ORF type:complete len:178 (-),score=17.97 GGOE01013649.1:279-782(-)